MRYLKYLLMVLVLLLQIKVNAANTCSTSELERLKYLADKVEFTYDFEWEYVKTEKVNGIDTPYYRANFTIHAHNLNEELRILVGNDYLKDDNLEFKNNGKGEGSLKGFRENKVITITIYAYTNDDCLGKVVATKKVALPHFNALAYTPVCQKNPEFKYCKEWTENGNVISSETFYREYEEYIKDLEKENVIENKDDIKDNSKNADNTSKSVYVWIIIGVIVLSLIATIITAIILNKRKDGIKDL